MSTTDILQAAIPVAFVAGLAPLLGWYMARIFKKEPRRGMRNVGYLEKLVYRIAFIDPAEQMTWRKYAACLLLFNAAGFAALFLILLFQNYLPLNAEHCPGLPFLLALNTAVSFVTNTNWQAYAGEAVMSRFSQMAGLTVQNFLSASTGIAVAVAFVRGLRGNSREGIGNFWSDMVRATLYIFLPLSMLLSILLVSQGTVQTFRGNVTATTLEGRQQVIPLGPVASQVAIKQLGTNGGGYYNANSAHPFENPTPLSNLLELIAILLVPAACAFMYGRLAGSPREGRALFAAMAVLLLFGLLAAVWSETSMNPALGSAGFMEGKEVRFGPASSAVWAVFTTAASSGSVNAMHSSLSPVTALVALVNMLLGEVIFGGVGSGLYGMLVFAIITVFIAGLMVGRTPELLGKKIEAFEIKMAMIAVLLPSIMVLFPAALAIGTSAGRGALSHGGPHGFTEALYAFASAANNNGSAFAGLRADADFYTVATSIAMLVGRYGVILPVLAMAGSLSRKKPTPISAGTFPTHGPMFVLLLLSVVLVVGALTFFPALVLGPVLEHLLMIRGTIL
jgi:potassium-transporting ATPase potassium-binding subunit